MTYPNSLVEVKDGVLLYVPDSTLVKTTYENLLAKNSSTPFPFWAKIWPASIALSNFLQTEPHWIKNKRVVEIGAGIGLPSFLIAPYTTEIIISDYAIEAVELIEKNIEYLGLKNIKAMCLDWNHFPLAIYGDTILLSDINYAPAEFESLLLLINRLLQKGCTILIATPQRIMTNPFVEKLKPFIKRTVIQTVETLNETTDIGIVILSR